MTIKRKKSDFDFIFIIINKIKIILSETFSAFGELKLKHKFLIFIIYFLLGFILGRFS